MPSGALFEPMTKHTEQRNLEAESVELGVQRHHARVAKARSKGHASQCPEERDVIAAALEDVAQAVRRWKRSAARSSGLRREALPFVRMVTPERAAFLAMRAAFDRVLSSRGNSKTSVAWAISGLLQDEAVYAAIRRNHPEQWQRLWRATKRGGHEVRRNAAKAIADEAACWSWWSHRQRAVVGGLMVELLVASSGAFALKPWTDRGRRTRQALVLTPAATKVLADLRARHEVLHPVHQPMVVEPLQWGPASRGGYLTNEQSPARGAVRAHRRLHQGEVDRGVTDEVFDALNAVSRTPWTVNEGVLQVLEHLWGGRSELVGLPHQGDLPLPERPSDIDTNEAALKAWKRAARRTHSENASLHGRRAGLVRALWTATKFRGRRLFFPHFCDFRGRLYPIPPYLNPQGDDMSRGLLSFADPKPVGERGLVWLARHGASVWGHGVDRLPWEAREAWAHSPEVASACRETAQDELETVGWWSAGEKPWQTLAWAREWGRALDEGPSFRSSIPVSVDGSNNGLQIYSLMTLDEVGGASTNCAPSPTPRDAYQDVADEVFLLLQGPFDDPKHAAWASAWRRHFGGRVPREAVKRSVMTLPYGSTLYACQKYVRTWFEGQTKDLLIFGSDGVYRPCYWLAGVVWEAIGRTVGRARDVMDWLRAVSDAHAEANLPVRWTSPSGFLVVQDYRKWRTRRLKMRIGDSIRYSRYLEDMDDVDGKKAANGLAPNFVHSVDAACLVRVVNAMNEHTPGVCMQVVHDAFGTHAADMPRLSVQVRESYREVFSDDLLSRAFEQFNEAIPRGIPPPPGWRGTLDLSELDRSDYFFA